MDRELDPVYRTIRDALEPELTAQGFRLASERHDYAAFGSAQTEYYRRGLRLRLTWDGKERWAWVTYAPQPTSAFPRPDTYRDLDAGRSGLPAIVPSLRTPVEAVARAADLIQGLHTVLAQLTSNGRAV